MNDDDGSETKKKNDEPKILEKQKKQRKAEAKRKRLKNCKKSIADIFPEKKEEGYDTTQDAVDDENSSRNLIFL